MSIFVSGDCGISLESGLCMEEIFGGMLGGDSFSEISFVWYVALPEGTGWSSAEDAAGVVG